MSDDSAPLDLSLPQSVCSTSSSPSKSAKSAFTPIRLPPLPTKLKSSTNVTKIDTNNVTPPIKLTSTNQHLLCQLATYDSGTLEALSSLISLSLLTNPAAAAQLNVDVTDNDIIDINDDDIVDDMNNVSSSTSTMSPQKPTGSSRRKCKTTRRVIVDDQDSQSETFTRSQSPDGETVTEENQLPVDYVTNPCTGNKVRRNYKNMTRERRVEANARERTRVHTIGNAFDGLRAKIPMLKSDQKLSKLSILRITCGYIMLLAAMNGKDYSADQKGYSVDECVQMFNETLVNETKPTKAASSVKSDETPTKKSK